VCFEFQCVGNLLTVAARATVRVVVGASTGKSKTKANAQAVSKQNLIKQAGRH
jgi:hypothetical protein